jgi:hypothetical protein
MNNMILYMIYDSIVMNRYDIYTCVHIRIIDMLICVYGHMFNCLYIKNLISTVKIRKILQIYVWGHVSMVNLYQ